MVQVYKSEKVDVIQTAYEALPSKAPKTKAAVLCGALAIIGGMAAFITGPRALSSIAFDAVLGGIGVVAVGGAKLRLVTHTSDKEHAQELADYLKYNERAGQLITETYEDLEVCRQAYMPIGPLFPQELEHEKNDIPSTGRLGVNIREKVPYRRINHTYRDKEFLMLARLEKGEKIVEFFRNEVSREKRIAELYQRPQRRIISALPKRLLEGSKVSYTPLIDSAEGKIRPLLTDRDFLLEYHGVVANLDKIKINAPRYLTREEMIQDRAAYEKTALDLEGPKTLFMRLSKRNGMFPLTSINKKGDAYLRFFESQTARERFIADRYTAR